MSRALEAIVEVPGGARRRDRDASRSRRADRAEEGERADEEVECVMVIAFTFNREAQVSQQ